jgi:flagellar hook protein FlgE
VSYSRNGQFHIDANGFLVNDTQANVTGYIADSAGLITASTPQALSISTKSIDPVATGASGSAKAGVTASLQLDSTQSTKTWVTPATATQAPNTNSYNYSTALTVYDSLGNPHSMTMYFTKDAPNVFNAATNPTGTDVAGTTGAWNVHYQVDGVNGQSLSPSMGATRLNFDNSGTLISPALPSNVTIDLAGVMTANGKTNSAATPLSFTIDYRDSTQFGAKFSVNELTQDGYTSGNLAGLSIGKDGVIQGNYSNGQTKNLAQIVLANFTNPNGLMSVGNNAWVETVTSGQPKVGTPDTGTLGVLQSGAVEESNVDLTAELVNMIVQQRNYQANAQSIKTQDQIMQTLVNIR